MLPDQSTGEADHGQASDACATASGRVAAKAHPPAAPVDDVLRGITVMIGSQLVFLLNDTFVKLSSDTLPMGEIIFLRGLVAFALIGGLVFALGLHRKLAMLANRLVAFRVAGELGATAFYIVALIHMPIANVIIIFQAVPLVVTAGAALFLGEAVGWRRWAAIGVGFVGVLIVVRPGPSGFDIYALFVLASVLFVTMRDLTTGALPKAIPTLLVTLATAAAVTVMGGCLVAVEDWRVPAAGTLAELCAAAILLSIGYAAIILAMRLGHMSVTASFRYIAIVFAIISGYLVWGDVPDGLTILGSLIIVGTGLYTLYRERKRARAGGPLIAAPAAIDPPAGG
jgi:drug/metabolite transporter (DMT)-like permease